MSPSVEAMRYVFGDCRFDTVSRELLRDGVPVHLSKKAYDLLKLLLEARPRAVSKTELMEKVWPDAFVIDANLPVLIGHLRAAIGDKTRGSNAIRTHSGIGYSFAAAAQELPEVLRPQSHMTLQVGARIIHLSIGSNVVGRDEAADVYINDRSVSREHARIVVDACRVSIEDLGSKNGTRVQGTPIEGRVVIANGDEVMFGAVPARLHNGADSSSTLSI